MVQIKLRRTDNGEHVWKMCEADAIFHGKGIKVMEGLCLVFGTHVSGFNSLINVVPH